MKKILILLIMILSLNLVSALDSNVEVQGFSTSPSSVEPGKQVTLTINLENIGTEDAEDVFVSLNLNDVPFAPVSGASSRNIDELEEDDQDSLSFTLRAFSDAPSGTYKIPVVVTYRDANVDEGEENETSLPKTTLVSIQVSGKPKLDLSIESGFGIINQNQPIDVTLTNKGKGDVKFLTVTLRDEFGYDIISNNKVYVGDVDSDDFETVTFDVIAFVDDIQLNLLVEYEDFNGNTYTEEKKVNLNVYTKSEAEALGLVQPNTTWIWFVVAGVVVLFFVIRRIRKKRKENAN